MRSPPSDSSDGIKTKQNPFTNRLKLVSQTVFSHLTYLLILKEGTIKISNFPPRKSKKKRGLSSVRNCWEIETLLLSISESHHQPPAGHGWVRVELTQKPGRRICYRGGIETENLCSRPANLGFLFSTKVRTFRKWSIFHCNWRWA